MTAESAERIEVSQQEEFKSIDKFLTRQRREIVKVLYNTGDGQLSHSELADKIESTPTSLWNACRQFEQFTPKLIKTETSGRYKLYGLTDIAKEYMRYKLQMAESVAEKRRSVGLQVLSDRAEEYRRQVLEAVATLKALNGDQWEVALDNYFLEEAHDISLSVTLETTAAVHKLLGALKKLIVEDDQNVYDEVLRECLSNSILQHRIEEHLRLFYCLRKLFVLLENKESIWDAYELLDVIFKKKAEEGVYKKLGLSENEYQRLRDALRRFADKEKSKGKQAIYNDICGVLDSNINIAMLLTDKIEEYHRCKEGT